PFNPSTSSSFEDIFLNVVTCYWETRWPKSHTKVNLTCEQQGFLCQ
ncbi:16922_t:CDS:1, partial [Acaulospora colombiana]